MAESQDKLKTSKEEDSSKHKHSKEAEETRSYSKSSKKDDEPSKRSDNRRGERRKLPSDAEASDEERRQKRRRRSRSGSQPRDYQVGRRYWGDRREPRRDRGRYRGSGEYNRRRNDERRDWERQRPPRESENSDPNSANIDKSRKPDIAKKPEVGEKVESDGQIKEKEEQKQKSKAKDPEVENLTTRTGGAYITPARLKMMQDQIPDKDSVAFQRIAWEALKKSINGLINRVNVTNISVIVRELLRENIIRGRGVLARSIMQAQAASPTYTHVFASLVAIINSKFPQLGELILRRLVIHFRRGFRRNDKDICLTTTRFIAHLVNQHVAHEILALQILLLLLENVTDHSLEVAIGFFKECGSRLTEVSPKGTHTIFERLRSISYEGTVSTRVQYMIEVMFAIRKDGFKDHASVISELELVDESDQFTHTLGLQDAVDAEEQLNVFKHDPEYVVNEEKYKTIKNEILDEDSSATEGSEDEKSDDEEDEDEENEEKEESEIVDNTETNLISLRRVIYLTVQSSLDFEECAHKMLKMELKPGQEGELCHMILDCCAQQRTYEKFFGLLAQRFCQLNKIYVEPFETIFKDSYETTHRLETNKLRNVAKLFAHLLFTDAINWTVLSIIKLNEEDTTSSSRIFIKILFQELSEYMGLAKLNGRVKDPTLQEAFAGLFPRDNPFNTRFAVNFFTSIGLGGLTDELREHLKSQPKPSAVSVPVNQVSSSSSSSTASSSSSSSSSSEEDSSSSSSDDDAESTRRHRRRTKGKSKDKNRKKKTTK